MPRLVCLSVVLALLLISALTAPVPHATYDESYPMYHIHTQLDALGEYIPQFGSLALKAATDLDIEKHKTSRLSRVNLADAVKGALRGKTSSAER